MWSKDIKCKYMFMFPLKHLARKEWSSGSTAGRVWTTNKDIFPPYSVWLPRFLMTFRRPDHVIKSSRWDRTKSPQRKLVFQFKSEPDGKELNSLKSFVIKQFSYTTTTPVSSNLQHTCANKCYKYHHTQYIMSKNLVKCVNIQNCQHIITVIWLMKVLCFTAIRKHGLYLPAILMAIRTLHDCPSQMNENLLISNSKLTSDSELIWWR